MPYLGELAAFSVALLWSVGSLLFVSAASRIGAMWTNTLRITIAAILLGLVHSVVFGVPAPTWITGTELALLGASGFVGLVIGDTAYFKAMLCIGPRRASVLFSLAPAVTALAGWSLLGETLSARVIVGMLVTIAGTAWVILERAASGAGEGRVLLGTSLGVIAAAGQALGLVLAKAALSDLGALSGTLVRMWVATVVAWLLMAVLRRRLRGHRSVKLGVTLLAASCLGPVTGVWLSLVAVQHTKTAIAATLMSLVPVLIIPIVMLVHHERPSARAVLGALVAVVGVALVIWR